jgi:sugar (pentulose or hexulose) kinase
MSDGLGNEQGRRRELRKFGYRAGGPASDYSMVWRQLRSDVPVRWSRVEFSALAGDVRLAAMRYCAHRATLDDLIDRCDEIHMEIFHKGPDPVRVETYAEARDRYEEAVERFGELRAALQAALAAAPTT